METNHKKITVEIKFNGEFEKFSAITNNMPAYDTISELEDIEKIHALYELIECQIIDNIAEWIENIEN